MGEILAHAAPLFENLSQRSRHSGGGGVKCKVGVDSVHQILAAIENGEFRGEGLGAVGLKIDVPFSERGTEDELGCGIGHGAVGAIRQIAYDLPRLRGGGEWKGDGSHADTGPGSQFKGGVRHLQIQECVGIAEIIGAGFDMIRERVDSNEGAPGTLKKRGLWEPHFYHLADGRLAVAYANEKHASETPSFSQTCSLKISASQGADWGAEIILADQPGGGALRPGMPVVARMGNGHYIAVYEVVGLGDADVCFKISKDGEHWAPGLGERIDWHHAGPWVTTLSDGRLLLTSCANTVSCSDDEGRTWHGAGVPPWPVGGGKKFTWPAIYQTAENEVAVMVSWHGVGLRLGDPGRKGGAKRETSRPESHTTRTIEGWNVRVDGRLLAPPWDGLGSRALRFLESKLSDIRAVVDAGPLEKLQRTTIVIDLNNGDLRPMQYHPNGKWLVDHGYAADLEKCVHIPVAADLATPRNIIEQPWVVLHELAHAYHDQVLGFEDSRIIRAYQAYKQSGHGDAALLYDGTRVRHYGLTDEKEFFAEMTESYFGVDDFFPFNRAELLAAEPQIHELMQEIWGSVAGRRLKPVGAVGSKATSDKP